MVAKFTLRESASVTMRILAGLAQVTGIFGVALNVHGFSSLLSLGAVCLAASWMAAEETCQGCRAESAQVDFLALRRLCMASAITDPRPIRKATRGSLEPLTMPHLFVSVICMVVVTVWLPWMWERWAWHRMPVARSHSPSILCTPISSTRSCWDIYTSLAAPAYRAVRVPCTVRFHVRFRHHTARGSPVIRSLLARNSPSPGIPSRDTADIWDVISPRDRSWTSRTVRAAPAFDLAVNSQVMTSVPGRIQGTRASTELTLSIRARASEASGLGAGETVMLQDQEAWSPICTPILADVSGEASKTSAKPRKVSGPSFGLHDRYSPRMIQIPSIDAANLFAAIPALTLRPHQGLCEPDEGCPCGEKEEHGQQGDR